MLPAISDDRFDLGAVLRSRSDFEYLYHAQNETNPLYNDNGKS